MTTTVLDLDYAELPLSGGYVAKVDAADYEWLAQWKWSVSRESRGRKKLYAVRREFRDGKWVGIKLHRLLLDLPPYLEDPERRIGHHKNDDGLDCRRGNLIIVRQFVNMAMSPNWKRPPGYPPPPSPTCNYELCTECARETDAREVFICAACRVGLWT